MAQTPDGYLWLGTRDGLARFDGVKFTLVDRETGLSAVSIRTIFVDRRGILWVASSAGGVSRLVNGKFQNLKQELGGKQVLSMTDDEAGRLWLGTQNGLFVLKGSRLEPKPELDELTNSIIRCVDTGTNGEIWIDTMDRGLMTYEDGRLAVCPGPPGHEMLLGYSLLADSQGRLWVGVEGGRLLCLEGGKWRIYDGKDGLPGCYIAALAEDKAGTIWAGSLDSGLFRFNGAGFEAFQAGDGVSANDIRSLQADSEGNLWVGTRTGGLNLLRQRKVIFAGEELGLTNSYIRGVGEESDGTLWVACSGDGLYTGNWDGFQPVRSPDIAPHAKYIETILTAADGTIWCGGDSSLMQLKDGKALKIFKDKRWIKSRFITALAEDRQGGLWIGNSVGTVVHYSKGHFTVLSKSTGSLVTSMAVETNGNLWVGSVATGLLRFSPDGQELPAPTNSLPSESIQALYLDDQGVLWIGTAGGGLSCYRRGSMTTFTAAQGFTARTVLQIVEDKHGNLWLGCRAGVKQVSKQALLDSAAGKIPFFHVRSFGASDGLQTEECAGGFSPGGLLTRSGLICIPTVKGLAFFDSNEKFENLPPPRALIETFRLNGQLNTLADSAATGAERSRPPEILIPPGDRNLEIEYTALRFSSSEKLGFRYRLAGVDKGWTEAGTRRTAYIQRLIPGRYTFEVQACDPQGHWNEQPAVLALHVQPFIWETVWFRVSLILAGAALLWWLVRRRYKIRLARLKMVNAIERERLRISKDMHDQVGGMLTQVSQLTDMAQGETKDETVILSRLDQIGKRARSAVQSLDEIVWATNPKNDNLASFAEYLSRFATEFLEFSNIRCRRDLPIGLPTLPLRADIRHNIFLAAREALNNIVKHSKATEVWIRLRLTGRDVEVEIQDNGCGFAPAETALGGNGLGNMRSRLAEEGGQTTITSHPGTGTTVRFLFQLHPDKSLPTTYSNRGIVSGEPSEL